MIRRLLTMAWVAMLVMLASVAAAQSAQTPPEGTGRISGTVTRGGGVAVPNAIVRWVRWVGGTGQQGGGRADAQGKFVFEKLLPGSYQVTAQAEGLVTVEFGQTNAGQPGKRIELAEGQSFDHADIVLFRNGAVEGIVTDEFGDPAPGITVQLAQPMMVAGVRRLMPAAGNPPQPSDDRGHYRVPNVPPGEYYVLALSGAFSQPETLAGFAPTFFPGTALPGQARAVRVTAGQDLLDVNFALSPAPLRTVTLRAADPAGAPQSAMLLLAAMSGGDVKAMITARGQTAPDGTFSFRNVPQGTYLLQGFGRPENGSGSVGSSPFGSQVVDVQQDASDVRLVIRSSPTMRGHILFEGDATQLKPSAVRLQGAPVEFLTSPLIGGGPPRMTVNDDWTFEVRDLFGLRVIRASVGAPGWYVKRVTLKGEDVTNTPIDFRNGDVNDVDVTLSNHPASITGAVMDGAAPVREFSVVLFAEDAAKWGLGSPYITMARPLPDGTFRLASLPGAAYLAVALTSVSATDVQDAAFLESLRGQATRVVVGDGETKSVTLKIIKR